MTPVTVTVARIIGSNPDPGDPPIEWPQSRALQWDDPSEIPIKDGYCAACRGNDAGEAQAQFSMIPCHVTDMNDNWEWTYSENQMGTNISNALMRQIMDLQIPDSKTIKQKANWAMWGGTGKWGGIMRANYPSGDLWEQATNIQMIASVWAGQLVEILESKPIWTIFNGYRGYIPMSRIRTYQPDEWDLPFACQDVTAVTRDNEHQTDPQGRFRWPIYFGMRKVWVLDRWLRAAQ